MAAQRILFQKGGNSDGYVLSGWVAAESHGRWTDGPESRLTIDGLRAGVAHNVTIYLQPFVSPPRLTHQDLRISVSGQLCLDIRLTEAGKVEFTVPGEAVNGDGSATMVFECLTATSPSALGLSSDTRRIGVSVWEISCIVADETGSRTLFPLRPATHSVPEVGYSAAGKFTFRVPGRCPLCENRSEFIAERDTELAEAWFPNWFRGDLKCVKCHSLPRQRALFQVLQMLYPSWRDLAIHESSSTRDGASRRLKTECPGYVESQYDPAIGFGGVHPGHGYRSEDLEAQTFASGIFDLVITQDVFEYLFEPDRAIREIARTLKPGGAHIMTVPIVNGIRPSQRRAQRERGVVRHHATPQFHGNPMSGEGSLVTVDWGYDIVDYLSAHSGLMVSMYYFDDLTRGLRAVYNEVLVCRKLGAPPRL